MDSLLGAIRSITIITHMTLITLIYPENVKTFFGSIFDLVAFELIQTDRLYPLIFEFDDVPYGEEFEALGYESGFIITNLGSLAAIMFLAPFVIGGVALFNAKFAFWRRITYKKTGDKV
jgi:hypothetical protein